MKTVHVAAGIIRKDGSDELLAVQRGYGDMQGLWEFPGGKLMRGETPEDAVRRELMEELQVKVTNLRSFQKSLLFVLLIKLILYHFKEGGNNCTDHSNRAYDHSDDCTLQIRHVLGIILKSHN